jgi:ATP-binding cassette subfamily F protein uup
VEQEPPLFGNLTVEDALLGLDDHSPEAVASSNSPYSVVRRYRSALKHSDAQQLAKAASLMEDVEGSWRILTKAEEVATKLRVWHLRASTVKSLSGGERKRLALAAALTQEPDVLLLDEPTNFLSLAGVQWLSDYLREAKKLSILLVTHDRAFLDDVCDRILELDQGKLYETVGSYSDYLQAKEDRLALQDAELQATKAKYRVELDWMRRQPQARETKSKSRIDAFHKLQKATKPCPRDPCLHLDAGATRRLGGKIVSMRNCNLKFGDKVILKDFSYDFCKGDRICLSGGNGVGKSAFVRVLTGELAPDSGTIDVGETIVMGVYDQMGIQLENPDQSLLDFVIDRVREAGTDAVLSRDEARDLLKTFEFPRKRWSDRVSHLSGGERRRLQMLSVFSRRPNFLVMDEPSVDCDLDTLQALERFLQDFKGVLLIVSHDRVFADKVTDHIFIFEGDGEVRDFLGSLSEYASTLVDIENESLASSLHRDDSDQKKLFNREDKAKRNEVRNVIRKAKKDMNSLERDIDLLKDQSESFQREIESGTEKGWSVLAELTEKLNSVSAAIEEKELRWMELAEQVEEFEAEAM